MHSYVYNFYLNSDGQYDHTNQSITFLVITVCSFYCNHDYFLKFNFTFCQERADFAFAVNAKLIRKESFFYFFYF